MSLIAELKRRNVFRVGAAYAIVAWLLVEVASVVLPTFEAPEWVMKVFTFLLILGFPLTLVIAWAFELTPEGVKREAEVDRAESITKQTGRKLDFAIIGLLVIVVVFLVVDNYVLEAEPEQAEVTSEAVPATEPTTQVKTIAVLPFANMSGDPEQEFFSDGISEELLNVLAKVKGLRVTSRTSAFAFKGKDISIPKIAAELGVEHVLEGSVRMAGDRVRITTQLIEVSTDSHLWSESYDRELSDIFAVQDEIAAKVGEALKLALLGADSRPIRPTPETSIEVYTDYLLARQKLASPTIRSFSEMELLLKGVIERDPNYAPGYAALAATYWYMNVFDWLSMSKALERMMPLVEQALSLDSDLAEAWQHLAYVRLANNDPDGARAARERALELNPRDPLVLMGQMDYWASSHEPERGRVFAEELLRVDPLSPSGLSWLAYFYARMGELDEADRMMDRIRTIDPKNTFFLWNSAWLATDRGDFVTAVEQMRKYVTTDLDVSNAGSAMAQFYFDLGDIAAANFWNKEELRRDPESPSGRLMAALLHLYQSEEAEAAAIAREIIKRGLSIDSLALRILAASDLASGNHGKIIIRNRTYCPELAEGEFPIWRAAVTTSSVMSIMWIALDWASAYQHAGKSADAESLLSVVESELPHWPKWWYGISDVELHALRGEKEEALAALREHARTGTRLKWRWQVLYNPNLESIRNTPEFAAIVAEIEADMAVQLARVREMERNGELEPIPELAAE